MQTRYPAILTAFRILIFRASREELEQLDRRHLLLGLLLTSIIFTLTVLNLEKVVFSLMGGIEPQNRPVNDDAYAVLFLISALSLYAFIPMAHGYLVMSITAVAEKRRERNSARESVRPQEPVSHG